MRIFIALLIVAGLASCGSKPEVPAGILSPEKMKLVMYDMMRSGEFLSGYVLYKDTSVNKIGESMKWYNKVFEIHKISEAEFRKSYEWYKANPPKMAAIMDSIMVIPTPPLARGDSARKAMPDSIHKFDPTDSLRMQRELRKDSLRRRARAARVL